MIILGTNSIKDTGFDVANSVRMNRGSSDYFRRTNNTAGTSDKIGTYSGWVKRSTTTLDGMFFEGKDLAASNYTQIYFQGSGALTIYSSGGMDLVTTSLYRDPSAWYHVCVAFDTTQGTAANRVKLYVNGTQVTSFATETYPSQNSTIYFGVNGDQQAIGIREDGALLWNGYMAEICYVDGQALAQTDFGEFDEDSGIWKPKNVSGLTFGNNGCYLDFQDASNLGNVVAGNSTDFTENGLTAIDQSTDTCTNNFATLNPLNVNPANTNTFSEGNLKAQLNGEGTTSTMAMASGNWYMEYKCSGNITQWTGVEEIDSLISLQYSSATKSVALYVGGATMYVNGANQGSGGYGSGWSSGDIGMIAFDADNARVYFGKNGGWWNGSSYGASSPSTYVAATTGKTYYFRFVKGGNTTCDYEVNFGGTQSFAISSGNTDGNDYGNFEYAVPSGYYSLCTKNLAEYG